MSSRTEILVRLFNKRLHQRLLVEKLGSNPFSRGRWKMNHLIRPYRHQCRATANQGMQGFREYFSRQMVIRVVCVHTLGGEQYLVQVPNAQETLSSRQVDPQRVE